MKYNLNDLNNKDPKIKYEMQKKILEISETNPQILYKDFDYFVGLLSATNNIMIWTGILVLGNLAKVDKENKLNEVLPKIIDKLNAGKMITACNTIKSLIAVIKARPELADELGMEIYKAKDYKYDTTECHNVLLSLVFAIMGQVWDKLSSKTKEAFIDLAKQEISNSRSGTAKKAQLFLKKYNK